jgi:hypothetical protein
MRLRRMFIAVLAVGAVASATIFSTAGQARQTGATASSNLITSAKFVPLGPNGKPNRRKRVKSWKGARSTPLVPTSRTT